MPLPVESAAPIETVGKIFFWRTNQQVLQVQQVSYSPPEKLFYVQEESKKRRR